MDEKSAQVFLPPRERCFDRLRLARFGETVTCVHCESDAVDVDLSPVGVAPAQTTRLLKRQRRTVDWRSIADDQPFFQLLSRLVGREAPHMIDVEITGGADGTYYVSLRCALFAPELQTATTDDWAEHVLNHLPVSPATVYEDDNLLTDYDLTLKTGWTTEQTEHSNIDTERLELELVTNCRNTDLYAA